jgi:hypothetical protein
MATQNTGNARNILVGASPLFLSVTDITSGDYVASAPAGTLNAFAPNKNKSVPAFAAGLSYTDSLNDIDVATAATDGTARVIGNPTATPPVAAAASTKKGAFYRNVGYTNNGLQVTYNPSYGSVTVDQLLDSAKLFKETMEVMIATEMAEGTLENVLAVFGQRSDTLTDSGKKLGIAGGALGEAPTERQLIAVGQAPTSSANPSTERVYYARRVLSVQQSQFSLARNAASTFPVTFRLLPSGNSSHAGKEYGFIVDRVITA